MKKFADIGPKGRDRDGHRWTEMPGMFCVYCKIEDPREAMIATHGPEVLLASISSCPVENGTKDEIDVQIKEGPQHFVCTECGVHVKADEDGCCASCGADCKIEACACKRTGGTCAL